MKVYEYQNPDWGKAFKKISTEFHKYAPNWVEWTDKQEEADLNILHVVGVGEEKYLRIFKNQIIIQHCYYTASPDKVDYPEYWKDALLTISFHNLPDYTDVDFNFYRMPWGADPEIFNLRNASSERPIKIFTTGHVASDESLEEVFLAAKNTGNRMYHTGENFMWNPMNYHHFDYMPEYKLSELLQRTQYVPCLRKIEGFEIMGIEGLFCGARPIVFDLPTYDFYKGHAEFISTDNIVEQLTNIFNKDSRPVTTIEHAELVKKFSWENIVTNMYKEIHNAVF